MIGTEEFHVNVRHDVTLWIVVLLQLLKIFSGYRKQRYIEEIMVFPNGTGYYVCPRCHITLEREFVAYCDRCGQHLGWKGYRKARIIRPKLPYPAGTGMLPHGDR